MKPTKKIFYFLIICVVNLTTNAQKSFCYSDFNGITTEIKLMDGGQGKIIIEENNITREGTIRWTITNNHYPNPENIFIRLSTGRLLKFEAINAYPPDGDIIMLMDTSGNMYKLCFTENSYESSSNSYTVTIQDNRSYSWARSQALNEAEEIKKNIGFEELIENYVGIWKNSYQNGRGGYKNYITIEKMPDRMLILIDGVPHAFPHAIYKLKLFIENSKGIQILKEFYLNSSTDISKSDKLSIETKYEQQTTDGEHLFYNELNFTENELSVNFLGYKFVESLKGLEVMYADFRGDFGLANDDDLKEFQKLLEEIEIKKIREFYGPVKVSCYNPKSGGSPEGAFYIKEDKLVHVVLYDLNLAVSHKNNSEAKFEYDSLLRNKGTFDIKYHPDNLSFLYKYNQETKSFKSVSYDDLKNISLERDELRGFYISIITKDYLGDIKETDVDVDLDLIHIKNTYYEDSNDAILYPKTNADTHNVENEFDIEIKRELLKSHLTYIKNHSINYFNDKKWLRRKKELLDIKVESKLLIDETGNLFLKSLSLELISNMKLKQGDDEIINFKNYLIEKLTTDLQREKLIPAQYLIDVYEGRDDEGKLIINQINIPVGFEFEHEEVIRIKNN